MEQGRMKKETYDEFIARGGKVKKEELVDNLNEIRNSKTVNAGSEVYTKWSKGGNHRKIITGTVGSEFFRRKK